MRGKFPQPASLDNWCAASTKAFGRDTIRAHIQTHLVLARVVFVFAREAELPRRETEALLGTLRQQLTQAGSSCASANLDFG